MFSIYDILRDNWLLLLIGQYPNGPLGGIACTLILSVLGIVLAFPLSVLLALARLSPWRLLNWPATALVYVARGVPLLMVILPQALFNMLPSMLSQFVSTIKETTLGYVINVPELTFAANQINNQLLT